ncbi:MAG: fibrobacter succinogenes major paralogous domain-containing protein, partial [Bacteroidales bacterium]|nr:fibrobacter succinogenes major paralogous domain-containing protein [Bacteroidales bacterium]
GPPTIGMVTPTDDRYTVVGTAFTPLTLTAEPAGVPTPTIQWYSNTTASTTGGTAVTGATSNSFTPPNATANTDGIYYYAVATDRCGRTATTPNTSGKHIVVPACNSFGDINCNMSQTPVFAGGSLGTPYFRTSETWEISGNGITQVWSDVVLAPGCNHVTYSSTGNNTTPYTSACKWSLNDAETPINGNGTRPTSTQAPGGSTYYGDYFSWCMVIRYADQLCPDNWRVPTCQDFVNLDVALGGSGSSSGYTDTDIVAKYVGTSASGTAGQFWGGAFVGYCNGGGTLTGQGSTARYWSSSESTTTSVHSLYFGTGGNVYQQDTSGKVTGLALRCVRDVP